MSEQRLQFEINVDDLSEAERKTEEYFRHRYGYRPQKTERWNEDYKAVKISYALTEGAGDVDLIASTFSGGWQIKVYTTQEDAEHAIELQRRLKPAGLPVRRTCLPDRQAQTGEGEGEPETESELAGKPGHPGLEHDELVYRLAKAQKAEAIRAKSEKQGRTKAWAEIAREVDWKFGYGDRGLALLRDARHRLNRVVNAGDEELLREIAEF